MQVLRTPDERFADLPDHPFEPHYAEIADGDGGRLRVHYVDEGSVDEGDADVVLLMHGEPSWSYLYRHMIPVLVDAGFRCVAPDLVGFGRSDKPTEKSDYTFARHVEWMRELLFDHLDLSAITFFGQDWGGLIGLRLVGEHPERYRRIVVANTGLPTGDRTLGKAFMNWQRFSQESPVFPIGDLIQTATTTDLPDAVKAAYDAPFPEDSYKAGARIFPSLVPTSPDDPAAPANRAAWEVLTTAEIPLLTAFSDRDPVTAGGESAFQREVAGAQGRPHVTIDGAGHFLQEDAGPRLASLLVDFVAADP